MMQKFRDTQKDAKTQKKNYDCLSLRKIRNRLIFLNLHFSDFCNDVTKSENWMLLFNFGGEDLLLILECKLI